MQVPPPIALVVDDEVAVGNRIGRLLEQNGWRALVAQHPERGLAMSRRVPIDLVVTDFEMPGMTGLELAANLWRRDADLPVVLISEWPEAGRLTVGSKLAFVPKPLDLSLLLARVDALANDRSRERRGAGRERIQS
jgi:DNA-binding response OmpR family regulator